MPLCTRMSSDSGSPSMTYSQSSEAVIARIVQSVGVRVTEPVAVSTARMVGASS